MANAFPLYLDLVPREKRNLVLNSLVNQILVADSGHLTTGVLGTKYLPEVLTENGRSDIAWMLVNQKGYPSWSQMMEKYNTMCEFWTLKQSHNHVMMGSIDSWFYEALAGVRLLESYPAYGRTILKPYLPDNLNRVDCTLQTVRGEVKSSWEKDGSILKMIVEIPFNCQSEVWIPGKNGSVITESGKPVNGATGITFVKREGDFSIYKIGSGNYRFEVREPAGKF
jgi:alpha-L-rhamnosidase